MDDEILELVADNDQMFEVDAMEECSTTDDTHNRPSTADGRDEVSVQHMCILMSSCMLMCETNDFYPALRFEFV